MRTKRIFVNLSCSRIKHEVSREKKTGLSRPVLYLLPFQGGTSVVLLCLYIFGFIYGVCSVLICSSSVFLLVSLEGCSSCLWHFLDIFTYF